MISCTRRLQWCSGHRVMGHENKCGHLHGHNYVGHFHARSLKGQLDEVGRVIDFSVLKEKIGNWIDENWDHGLVLCCSDHELLSVVSGLTASNGEPQKIYLMENNPTAENMANHLLRNVCPVLFTGEPVEVFRVTIQETENAVAEAWLEDQEVLSAYAPLGR